MKLKDIKGLLPNYILKPAPMLMRDIGFNECLDLLSEREIEVSVCDQCNGTNKWVSYDEHMLCYAEIKCSACTNGVLIKVKES